MLGFGAGQALTKDHLLLYSPSANWGKNPAPRSGRVRGLAKATQVRLSKPGQRLPTAPPGASRGRGEAVSEVYALLGVGVPQRCPSSCCCLPQALGTARPSLACRPRAEGQVHDPERAAAAAGEG